MRDSFWDFADDLYPNVVSPLINLINFLKFNDYTAKFDSVIQLIKNEILFMYKCKHKKNFKAIINI